METIWDTSIVLLIMLLFAVACGFAYFFSILVHELGHISAAWLVGWKPHALSIGFGRRRTLFSVCGVEFQVGSRLLGGLAYATANDSRWMRTKQFLFTSGGPFATACLAAVFLMLAQAGTDSDGLFWMLFWLQSWLLCINLWPHTIDVPPDQVPSDGLSMWRTFRIKEADLPQLWFPHAAHKVRPLIERGEDDKAIRECNRWLSFFTGGTKQHVAALDMMACIPVFAGCKALVPEALRWIEQVIEYSPVDITLQGTKGSLMVEAGNLTDAIALLEHVRDVSESQNDQAIVTWYLALAYLKRGDDVVAQRMLAEAKEKYARCIVAPRLSDEIAAISKEPCAGLIPGAAA